MNQVSTSYLLWLTILFGVGGVHRLYNGKYITGILWLLTGGLFGIGQVIDLLLIPGMVQDHNLRMRGRVLPSDNLPYQPTIQVVLPDGATASIGSAAFSSHAATVPLPEPPPTQQQLMLKLLKAAEARGGKLSVTQGVLDTGIGFAEIEATLHEMVKTGYVAVENHPATGVVLYNFLEL